MPPIFSICFFVDIAKSRLELGIINVSLSSSGPVPVLPQVDHPESVLIGTLDAYCGASSPAVYASRQTLPLAMQDLLPATRLRLCPPGIDPLESAYSLESYQPIPVKVTSQSRSKAPPDPRQSYRVGGGRRAIPRSDATRGRTLWLSCERSTSFGFDCTHGFSLQRDAIGIVHEAVKDRIGMGRFADHFVPVLDG